MLHGDGFRRGPGPGRGADLGPAGPGRKRDPLGGAAVRLRAPRPGRRREAAGPPPALPAGPELRLLRAQGAEIRGGGGAAAFPGPRRPAGAGHARPNRRARDGEDPLRLGLRLRSTTFRWPRQACRCRGGRRVPAPAYPCPGLHGPCRLDSDRGAQAPPGRPGLRIRGRVLSRRRSTPGPGNGLRRGAVRPRGAGQPFPVRRNPEAVRGAAPRPRPLPRRAPPGRPAAAGRRGPPVRGGHRLP